jgi:hypothetical protein
MDANGRVVVYRDDTDLNRVIAFVFLVTKISHPNDEVALADKRFP